MGKKNKVQPAQEEEEYKNNLNDSELPSIDQHRNQISFDPDIDVQASTNLKNENCEVIEESNNEESPES